MAESRLKPSHIRMLFLLHLCICFLHLYYLVTSHIVGLPLMFVKKRTLESSNLTLKHKQEVSGEVNKSQGSTQIGPDTCPSLTNPCCQREEVLWLVSLSASPTGSPRQITHSEGEQSLSGSKTELTKIIQSHYSLFLRLPTVKGWPMEECLCSS